MTDQKSGKKYRHTTVRNKYIFIVIELNSKPCWIKTYVCNENNYSLASI